MLPAGPLMVEHRLIERMIALMGKEAQKINQGGVPDTEFIRAAIDFVKVYADQLHHGKEEDILFKALSKKPMSAEHQIIMAELFKEHVFGREMIGKLSDALFRFLKGDQTAARAMAEDMDTLLKFYTQHIEKEDKRFFLPAMDYLSPGEQEAMLKDFDTFDRKAIHVTYNKVVSTWESPQA